jgi:hypothetical protein
MEKAALKAESLGDKDSAAELRKDYAAFSDPNRCFTPAANIIYNQIADAVRDTHGTWSFKEIVRFAADGDGMTSAMIISKYRKLRSVYDRAMAEGVKPK